MRFTERYLGLLHIAIIIKLNTRSLKARILGRCVLCREEKRAEGDHLCRDCREYAEDLLAAFR